MKSHGKKIFPGSNSSNIFFIDNPKNNKLDLNKYINKPHNNINSKQNINNKTIKDNSFNNQNSKMPIKKRVLKKYNSTTLKKGDINPFSKQNEIIKKRQLVSHRSVDYFNTKKTSAKRISLTEPNLNDVSISKELKQNSSQRTFTTLTQRAKKEPMTSRKIGMDNYYNKFINKNKALNEKKENINKNLNLNLKSARTHRYQEPKEEIFIIEKEKLDNNVIDINSLKKNILGKGISIVSLTGISSSLLLN